MLHCSARRLQSLQQRQLACPLQQQAQRIRPAAQVQSNSVLVLCSS
jgi:hypothetical protein